MKQGHENAGLKLRGGELAKLIPFIYEKVTVYMYFNEYQTKFVLNHMLVFSAAECTRSHVLIVPCVLQQ